MIALSRVNALPPYIQTPPPEYIPGVKPDLSRLNPEQAAFVESFIDYICGPSGRGEVIRLCGEAGAGKSYAVSTAIQQLLYLKNESPLMICLAAPTHQAVKVLRGMSPFRNTPVVSFKTLQSLCGMKATDDIETGDVKFMVSALSNNFSKYHVVGIDEASQISPFLFGIIESAVINTGVKLLIIGDSAQLPPVKGGNLSPILDPDYSNTELYYRDFSLVTQMRSTSGMPIHEKALAVRRGKLAEIETSKHNGEIFYERVVSSRSAMPVLESLKNFFTSKYYQDSPDYCKVLCYTRNASNNAQAYWNNLIRTLIFGREKSRLEPIIIGENISLTGPYFDQYELKASNASVCQNGDILHVIGYTQYNGVLPDFGMELPSTISPKLRVYSLEVTIDGEPLPCRVRAVDPRDQEVFESYLQWVFDKSKKARARNDMDMQEYLMAQYFRMRNVYARFDYGYALTIHRAQGSSFDYVFLDLPDINRVTDRSLKQKMLYVAISRARKGCYAVGE